MDIVKRGSQLDWEIRRRRTELGRLERALAAKELAIETFEDRLEAFRRRYVLALQGPYAELDELEAQVAERAAQVRPDDASKQRRAERARARADETAGHAKPIPAPSWTPPEKPEPTDDLRKLYRDLTKRVHPDLVSDPAERERREAIMTQVNAAYAARDAETLAYLSGHWEVATAAPEGDDAEVTLARIEALIEQAQGRLGALDRELAAAEETPLAKLMRRAELAERQGRDLMDRLVEEVEEAQQQARKRLKQLDRRLAKARRGTDAT